MSTIPYLNGKNYHLHQPVIGSIVTIESERDLGMKRSYVVTEVIRNKTGFTRKAIIRPIEQITDTHISYNNEAEFITIKLHFNRTQYPIGWHYQRENRIDHLIWDYYITPN